MSYRRNQDSRLNGGYGLMQVVVSPSKLAGTVSVPASKTYAHRMLIAASLADEPTLITGEISGKDTTATIEALQQIGAKITKTASGLIVEPIKNITEKHITIDANESGSTLRFMLPVVASLGITATFIGKGRLGERPLLDIIETLKAGGVECDNDRLPLTIKGKLQGNTHTINGSVSSQYITGMMLALGAKSGEFNLNVVGKKVSASYINNTIEVLEMFGVGIQTTQNGYTISGKGYHSCKECEAIRDWSSGAFFAVAGAIGNGITLVAMDKESKQADSAIIGFLEQMGAKVCSTPQGLNITGSGLMAIECTVTDCPDLVPILSIAMAVAKGTSIVKDVNRLRVKESDRLQAIIDMLQAMQIKATTDGNTLYIEGGNLVGGYINGCNDHRMVMSGIIAGSVASGTTTVSDVEACAKSYAEFTKDFESVGGIIC